VQQIGDSITSLLLGTYRDFELLVRDDGSPGNGTEEAVAVAAGDDPRVRYHRNKRNLRMPGNLNAGIAESRGEIIAVCHDHDLYKPNFLEQMVACLDRNPSALFVHAAINVIDDNRQLLTTNTEDWPELTPGHEWLRFMLRRFSCPVCALTLVRRSAHEQFGLYDPQYWFISDVEMWMRLSAHGDVAYVREPVIDVRVSESGHAERSRWAELLRTNAAIHWKYWPLAYPQPVASLGRAKVAARFVYCFAMDAAANTKRRLLRRSRPTNDSPSISQQTAGGA
jgi:glycosyltransferase involved in cell wall biosynthesis